MTNTLKEQLINAISKLDIDDLVTLHNQWCASPTGRIESRIFPMEYFNEYNSHFLPTELLDYIHPEMFSVKDKYYFEIMRTYLPTALSFSKKEDKQTRYIFESFETYANFLAYNIHDTGIMGIDIITRERNNTWSEMVWLAMSKGSTTSDNQDLYDRWNDLVPRAEKAGISHKEMKELWNKYQFKKGG